MPKIAINDIEIEYQRYGPNTGEAESIIFLHGAGGNLLSWFQQIPYFSRKYDCIVFSHRGFGHSYDSKHGPGMKSFPDDLRSLVDALEIKNMRLVAQSMGGRTALGFAVTHPERVSSITFADTTGAMGEIDVETALSHWRESNPDTKGIGFRALSDGFRTRNPSMANLYLQIQRSNPQRPESGGVLYGGPKAKDLKKLIMPVQFIVGEDDEITPPHILDLASAHIKGSKLIIVPDCGHSVYFEKPEIFNFEVEKFIDGSC
jgi:pimeloyl-ACP methyl ester carboxylesterase